MILASRALTCACGALSLMKTSISTRFLRLVAPELRFWLTTSTRPRMAMLMNTVRTAARVMTQLRRSEPSASPKKNPVLT